MIAAARIVAVLAPLSVWFDVPVLRQVLSVAVLLIIPGWLLLLLLDITFDDVWEYLAATVGLSLGFLVLAGLFLNQALSAFQYPGPLGTTPVLVSMTAFCLAGSELALRRTHTRRQIPLRLGLSRPQLLSLAVPMLFPVLAIGGAVLLNHGGGNWLALGALLLIAVYWVMATLGGRHLSPHALPFSILLSALALLLSMSLRGPHIGGWDINQEFYVYQLTESNSQWSIERFRDPYNACISVTILPTIINVFAGIDSEHVFRVFYPAIFAVLPLVVFLTARRYVSPVLAYLASAFFVFQPWFVQPMAALARQQIALLFFALFVWALFHPGWRGPRKNALLLVFGVSIVLSHYSTSYIALGIFTLVFISSLIVRKVTSLDAINGYTPQISAWLLVVLCGITFYWGTIVTETSGHLPYVALVTLSNMKDWISSDLGSQDVQIALGSRLGLSERPVDIKDVEEYIFTKNQEYAGLPDLSPPGKSGDFVPRVVTSVTESGVLEDGWLKSVFGLSFSIARQLTKILLVLGGLVMGIRWLKSRSPRQPGRRLSVRGRIGTLKSAQQDNPYHPEYVLLSLISVVGLWAFIGLPVLPTYYNLSRAYMQVLVVTALCIPVGASFVLSLVRSLRVRVGSIAGLAVIFFLSSYGATALLVDGPAKMNLFNYGEDYDKFYTHETEVLAARWLSERRSPGTPVYADAVATLRLMSFGGGLGDTATAILPTTIRRNSYVFARFANLKPGITEALQRGVQISYNFPLQFLSQSKNLIYDNGGSQVFR